MREFVEERQRPKHIEVLLIIEAVVFLSQILVDTRQFGRHRSATRQTFFRVFLHRRRNGVLECRGEVIAIGVYRRRRCVNNLMQQLGKIVSAERTKSGQQFVHDRTERIQVRFRRELFGLHLFRRHVTR